MPADLKLIDDWYEFTRSLTERVTKFPRLHRFTLGADLGRRCTDVLDQLIRAKFAPLGPGKVGHLRDANVGIELLRFHLRLAHDLKALSHDAHRHAVESLQNCGRQVGGWIKSLDTRDAT